MLAVPKILRPAYWVPTHKRRDCAPVEREDMAAVPELVRKMAQYCRDHDGVGLAAPQVGIYKRLAIVLSPYRKVDVFINPMVVPVIGQDAEPWVFEREGCLSLPPSGQNMHTVRRWQRIQLLSGTEDDPFAAEQSEHTGLMARIIQHEVDHLEPYGEVFFVDRLGKVARDQIVRRHQKWLRLHPVERLEALRD